MSSEGATEEDRAKAAALLSPLLSEMQALRERVEGAEKNYRCALADMERGGLVKRVYSDAAFGFALEESDARARSAEFLLALIAAGAENTAKRLAFVRTARAVWNEAANQASARAIAAEAERDALREGLAKANLALTQFVAFEEDARYIMGPTNFKIVQSCHADIRALLSSPPLGNEGNQGDTRSQSQPCAERGPDPVLTSAQHSDGGRG